MFNFHLFSLNFIEKKQKKISHLKYLKLFKLFLSFILIDFSLLMRIKTITLIIKSYAPHLYMTIKIKNNTIKCEL